MTIGSTPRRRQRTWSAFGDVRRLPSEYEIVTHKTNWTLREGRKAALEQNPSSVGNLWLLTYRDCSPLTSEDWDGFRDPDLMTYRKYVATQDDAERALQGVLSEYSDAEHDASLDPSWAGLLQLMTSTTRFPLHGCQQVLCYLGYVAPSSYITNAAVFAASDLLRRNSVFAYRTRELADAFPDQGFGQVERGLWQTDPVWQPTRQLIEYALVTYDWAEAFTAMNLVILPTLDQVLLTQLRAAAQSMNDDLTWLLLGNLEQDAARRGRWSAALARKALADRPDNRAVLDGWISRWAPQADQATAPLADKIARAVGTSVSTAPTGRERLLVEAGLLEGAPT